EGVIDFSQSRLDREVNVETYSQEGLPEEGVAYEEYGGVTLVRLKLTSEGMVAEISFDTIVF
ncbi:MAG: hypothetical protein F6K47_17210, partial [Symploca sp. SIO2E6]|nr:hypothetical protein [Symploca sp. SIO2E6]